MKQKKRYIIEVADGKYLDGCAWSQFTNQAKLFSKKKKAHEWLGRLLPHNPEAQILKYNPTSGCYEPLKQKPKLQPVTDSEAKETEAEADSGEETTRLKLIQGIYDGLEVAFQYGHEFNLTDGYAEIVLEGKEVPMDTDILSECGWERMESSGDGDAIWHFEIGKDSIHSVCSLCFDSGHTEAHCPQKVSKSG